MVTYIYQHPDGSDADEPSDDAVYSVMELRQEHRRRYVMETSKGIIILRRLPYRLKRRIDATRYVLYPKLREMEREVADLAEGLRGVPPEDWPHEAVQRIDELRIQISMRDMSALGVIVAPLLADMDEYEALYESLAESERLTLDLAVQELARPRDPSEVDATADILARHEGIRLMTEEELEMMTVSQAAYHISRINAEAREIQRREREMDEVLGIKRVG